jgi:hypothetical protein
MRGHAGVLTVAVLLAAAMPARSFAQTAGGAMPPHDQAPAAQTQTQPDQSDYPRLKITGFGDLTFASQHIIEYPRGFTEGQFVLHMASALSPRATFFGELSFTPRADAGTGTPPATGFNAEVERMILRLDHSDRLKVSFGRYHTPVNWWNTAFHHGSWLQTTIQRPEMVQFGGRFLPVHFVGALVEGTFPAAQLNLSYQAGIGNGRGFVISRGGDAGDNNGRRAVVANLFSRPDKAYGLQFGGSVYLDTISQTTGREFQEQIYAGHVAFTKEDPELIAEVAAVRHREGSIAPPTWSHAYYIQAAYRLPQFNRLWKPYYRFEHIGVNATDVVFADVPNLDGSTLGVRYDATTFAAIKLEYRNWKRGPGTPRNWGGFLQVCFTF